MRFRTVADAPLEGRICGDGLLYLLDVARLCPPTDLALYERPPPLLLRGLQHHLVLALSTPLPDAC